MKNVFVLSFVLILFLGALAVTARIQFGASGGLSVQSNEILYFSTSLRLSMSPGERPPGYTLFIYGMRQTGLPVQYHNLLLLYGTLISLFLVATTLLPTPVRLMLLLLYGGLAAVYYNTHQYTAENLVIPLSLLILLCLHRYLRSRNSRYLVLLTILSSWAFLARFHSLFWLLPIVFLHLLLVADRRLTVRVQHALSFGVISFFPVGGFLVYNLSETGFLTGMDRFSYAARQFPWFASHFPNETGFTDNLRLMLKTYYLDFFSLSRVATHIDNHQSIQFHYIEIFVLALFLLCLGLAFYRLSRLEFTKGEGSFVARLFGWYRNPGLLFLVTEFWLAYIVVTLFLWTVGNNDPIYTRFMFPSYPYFVILCCCLGYWLAKFFARHTWVLFLTGGLYLSVVLSNLYKIVSMLNWL